MSNTEALLKRFVEDEILHGASSISVEPERLLLEEGILDSLGLQQLVTFLESEFSVEIEDDYLTPENFESVRAIASFVDAIRG